MTTKTKIFLALLIVALAAASRLVPHPFNFTPIAAIALFSGCYFQKRWSLAFPLAAMILSDVLLYATKYGWSLFDWKTTLAVYAAVALAFVIGRQLSQHKTWYFIGGGAVISSLIFFFITNFAVWAFFSWYPHTLAGLLNCFTMAIPFFRNSLAGDLTYTALSFGAYEAVLLAEERKLSFSPGKFN